MNHQQNTGQILAGRILKYATKVKVARGWERIEEIQNKVFELLELAILLRRNHQISEVEGDNVQAAWESFADSAQTVMADEGGVM